jgi:4-carboxymuconolactone decarboxylase
MGDMAQKFGAYTRFDSSIPHKRSELAIVVTARLWNSRDEWYAHHKYGIEALIDAIAAGNLPAEMAPDEAAVYLYSFCRELLETRQVSDATFDAVKEKFGERGVVDLIGVVGHYHIVSMALNVDRYPLPDGAKPELQALK